MKLFEKFCDAVAEANCISRTNFYCSFRRMYDSEGSTSWVLHLGLHSRVGMWEFARAIAPRFTPNELFELYDLLICRSMFEISSNNEIRRGLLQAAEISRAILRWSRPTSEFRIEPKNSPEDYRAARKSSRRAHYGATAPVLEWQTA